MVYLMIINRSREIVSIMGHDVKQFKSLEGFLEAGPQFVLQTYILLSSDPEDEDRGEQSEASKKEVKQRKIVAAARAQQQVGKKSCKTKPSRFEREAYE